MIHSSKYSRNIFETTILSYKKPKHLFLNLKTRCITTISCVGNLIRLVKDDRRDSLTRARSCVGEDEIDTIENPTPYLTHRKTNDLYVSLCTDFCRNFSCTETQVHTTTTGPHLIGVGPGR